MPPLEPAGAGRPAGFELSAGEARAIAIYSAAVKEELGEGEERGPSVFTRGDCLWQVSFYAGDDEVARVLIDDGTGEVLEAWDDEQVGAELARGYEGAVAQAVNSPWVWIPLCLLFVAPFFDFRRPFRLLHLDLLAIVGLSASLFFFNRAEIEASVALTYPVLGYVLLRMLYAGFRPAERHGPLARLGSGALAGDRRGAARSGTYRAERRRLPRDRRGRRRSDRRGPHHRRRSALRR